MGRGVPEMLSFSGGEWSPLLYGRTDQERYSSANLEMSNFLPTLEGPAIRRGGTPFVAETKNNGVAWLSRFVFNNAQSYILEWGTNYLRFYVNRGQLQFDGMPYEIVTPWHVSELTTLEGTFALNFEQANDVLYISHTNKAYRPYTLSRLGATNWSLVPFQFANGPFETINPDETVSITVGLLVGSATLNASGPIFAPTDVGSAMILEKPDNIAYATWEPGKVVVAGDKVTYGGNYYAAVNGATTGTIPPTHIRGIHADGQAGVAWLYLHSGYGHITITSYTSPTVVSGFITKRMPGNGANVEIPVATTRWAFRAFSDTKGWPTCHTFYKNRLVWGKDITVYMSYADAFGDYEAKTGPEPVALNAIILPISLREARPILWLREGNKGLLGGMDEFEFIIRKQTESEVFGPGNVDFDKQTAYGSLPIAPLEIGTKVIHVESGGIGIRELGWKYETEKYESEPITLLCSHIPLKNGGIIDFCHQKKPDPRLWYVTKNGTCGILTLDKTVGVIGGARVPFGGYGDMAKTVPPRVLSVECIPSADPTYQDPWFIVERYINGNIRRHICYMEDYRIAERDLSLAMFVDNGLTYEGEPATVLGGSEHLVGETVQVFADGRVRQDVVVDNLGQITLSEPASTITWGLKYTSILSPLRINFGAEDGASQSRMKSISDITVRFKDTLGGKRGISLDKLSQIEYRSAPSAVGVAPKLFNGDKRMDVLTDWTTDGYIYIVQDQPLPMTVVAIYPRVHTND